MNVADSSLQVFHLYLSPPSLITQSIIGYFSQTQYQEIISISGNGQLLHLCMLLSNNNKAFLQSVCIYNTFCNNIHSLHTMNSNDIYSNEQKRELESFAIFTTDNRILISKYENGSSLNCFPILSEYQLMNSHGNNNKRGIPFLCHSNLRSLFTKDQPLFTHHCKCVSISENDYLFCISNSKSHHIFIHLRSMFACNLSSF